VKKLLTIGHSYVVSLNRRLANEIAKASKDTWEVTVVAPSFMHGDLRSLSIEADLGAEYSLIEISVYFSKFIHVMLYDQKLKEILQQKWDLVHCWEEPYIFAGGQIAWWHDSHIPLVYKTDQSNSKKYIPPFNSIENFAMRKASGWICCGELGKEALANRSHYNIPMRLIPYGVDISYFYPDRKSRDQTRQLLGWDEKVPVVGFLGRLVPEKGLDLLMNVLNRLSTPWRALFVGTGLMEPKLKKWADKFPERVRICTDVRHNDAPRYLNAMDILCAPSQTMPNWKEQFGRMLIEAFACGIPVIGSDSGEIPYVIGDAGLVVGEKDEEGWVKAIANLLENQALRQELSLKGLDKAKSKYSWSIIAKQHLEFFEELIETKKTSV
jgi:glycosyltransferase involved in cell wall biosynthesis